MLRPQRHAHDGCYDATDVTPLPVRHLPVWGLSGYALRLTGGVAEIFGTGISLALSIPGGLPEVALGRWLIIRGFNADGCACRRSRSTRTWHQRCERPRGRSRRQELGARRQPSVLMAQVRPSGEDHPSPHHKPLSVRTYHCDSCDLVLDRDVNAAVNLAAWGERHLATPGVA